MRYMQNVERRSVLKGLFAAISTTALSDLAPAQSSSGGIMVAAGQDRYHQVRNIGVSSTTYKVATSDTQGALFVIEHSNTRPGGPPLHLHYAQDEFWYVLAGEYLVEIGADRYTARAGDSVLGPRNVPHRFAFTGGSPGRILIAFTPAGKMEEFFALEQTRAGQYTHELAVWEKYGMKLLGPPLPV